MLLGIDVGGTYTDAVLVHQHRVLRSTKVPTTRGDLLQGILGALDGVLDGNLSGDIQQIALSTTLITNAIVENKTDPVGVLVIPGPGMNIEPILPTEADVLTGSIDHRGREVVPVNRTEVEQAVARFCQSGIRLFAVVGKFSVRNPAHELMVARWVREGCPTAEYIALGHRLGGALNFPRRIHTATLNADTWLIYQSFVDAVEEAFRMRRLKAPVVILKADGGTLPLKTSRDIPVETIFTGPAASILGIQALCEIEQPSVTLDVGGTTTDIALFRHGEPILAPKGARVGKYLTQVRSFSTQSIGVGGDSWVRTEQGQLIIGPERKGLPAALGGSYPTITDALCVLRETGWGDRKLAINAINSLDLGRAEEVAEQVLEAAASRVAEAVSQMITAWEQEPLYRVHELLHQPNFNLKQLVGVGGGANGFVQRVARKLGCSVVLPKGGIVANAIGAAVSKPTLMLTLRVDTELKEMVFIEEGIQQPLLENCCDLEGVIAAAKERLSIMSVAMGLSTGEIETVYSEIFNVVRRNYTTGKIITAQVQLRPGILTKVLWEAGDLDVQ